MTTAGEKDIITKLAETSAQLQMVLSSQADMESKLVTLDQRVKEIERMATTYKGGFLAVLTMGAVMGWIMNNMTWLKALFVVRN